MTDPRDENNPYLADPTAQGRAGIGGGTGPGSGVGFHYSREIVNDGSGAREYISGAMPKQPWRILAIIGFVAAFLFSLLGLGLSIAARVQSKRAGEPSGLALAGIIVSIVRLVLDVALVVVFVSIFSGLFAKCAELGPGEHVVDGVTYSCS
ncbi:hypothetical protein [Schumannella sp. 10F1B-5-1]|uniref:hypothetical protein n=1 Tax=Schumannella sp. 10F1B-5-1 TaxID=2590780 RepID=UPI0011326907|nr:hypothetical protein [Schumannella sp. 10F1B-5-1]TPW76976.1 hypothetical protein FJ658_03400 [Schumannella sp. 10F1B-5-1]